MGSVEKGKKLFLTMVAIILIISLVSAIVHSFSRGFFDIVKGIIRTGLEGILLYYIFKGKRWAKITMITFLSIAVLFALILVLFSKNIIFIILLLVYCGSIYTLAFSPGVKEYLKSVNS